MVRHWRLLAALVLLVTPVVFFTSCSSIRPPRARPNATVRMLTTGYCRCGICCGWSRTWYGKPVYSSGPSRGQRKEVGVTASGTRARLGTIAADRRRYPFGTVMYIPGYGYGRVEDVGGGIKGEHIDLFFESHGKALEWGNETKQVQVWYPRQQR